MALNFGGNPHVRPECLRLGLNILLNLNPVSNPLIEPKFKIPIPYQILLELKQFQSIYVMHYHTLKLTRATKSHRTVTKSRLFFIFAGRQDINHN